MGDKPARARHEPPHARQSAVVPPAKVVRRSRGFGTVRLLPLGRWHDARLYSCQRLNQLLADTQILHALYKKHDWLMRGATFYQLHLLLDKHARGADRAGGFDRRAGADPRHVAKITRISRAPNGCEEVPAMFSRLLEAHELILADSHDAATRVGEQGDDGTNDLIVSGVIRTGEVAGMVPRGVPRRHPTGADLAIIACAV